MPGNKGGSVVGCLSEVWAGLSHLVALEVSHCDLAGDSYLADRKKEVQCGALVGAQSQLSWAGS